MKQVKTILIAVLLLNCVNYLNAESPKCEMRAAWVSTAWNLDWPSSRTASASTQQAELRSIIDDLHAANFNAVFLQVRGFSDAFYKSSYEPWSYYLTGTRGKAPSYDPLQYAIDYAHSKGIELHAWVNPYRYSSSQYNYGTLSTDYAKTHPEWIMHNAGNSYETILNPGIPAVREQIAKVVAEIVTNYDVDGVVFDDYFYLNGATQDSEDQVYYNQYNPKGLSRADWRRDQVNQMVELVHTTIKKIKPYVRFGISPAGVAGESASKYGVPRCPVGADWQYNGIYSDPLAWISSQTIDYISPQIYWAIGNSTNDYKQICNWWSTVANKFGRHFYSSHSLSNLGSWGANEYVNQVSYNRQYDKNGGAPGSVFFNISDGLANSTFMSTITNSSFTNPACLPAMTWQSASTLAAPTNLTLSGSNLSWNHASATRFTVYAYTKGSDQATALASSRNLVAIVYGKSIDLSSVSGYASKTLAVCAYDRYGNEYAPAIYNAEVQAPSLTSSTATLHFEARKSQSPAPYKDVVITASNLTSNISVAAYSNLITVAKQSGWDDRKGGTLRITLNTNKEIGNYSSYVAVQSAAKRVQIDITANITEDVDGLMQLWSKTASEAGLSTANGNRSMAYYNGKLYIPNKDDGKCYIFNAANGSSLGSFDIVGGSSWQLMNLRVTTDGQMLYGNSGIGSSTLTINASNLSTGGTSTLGTEAISGRSDYFYPYGSWAKTGYLLAVSKTGNVVKIPFNNSRLQTASSFNISWVETTGGSTDIISAKAIPAIDGKSFYVTVAYRPAAKYSLTTGDLLEEFSEEIPTNVAASGLGLFDVSDQSFMVVPANEYGAVDLFNITSGLSTAMRIAPTTPSLGSTSNEAYTIDICTSVSGNVVNIYVLAPNNGIAAYTITIPTHVTGMEQCETEQVEMIPTADGVELHFNGMQNVQIYGANGVQLVNTMALNNYHMTLSHGMYIIRVGNTIHKFIK